MHHQILFAKIGWADRYDGDSPEANTRDESWCERHNFLEVETHCYGYITHINGKLPNPKRIRDNWVVIFVAPWKVHGPEIVPVGIYFNAKLETNYKHRPDGLLDCLGQENFYCVSTLAANAVLIPPDRRLEYALPSEATAHFTRQFCYARSKHVDNTQEWRRILAETAEQVCRSEAKPSSI